MALIDISIFKGEIPRVSEKLLPNENAARAINCDLASGALKPIKGLVSKETLQVGAETVYRLGDRWLQWRNKVDIIESLVYNSGGRIIFTGDHYPKETNSVLALGGTTPYPSATRRLGISAPTSAPSHAISSAGSGTVIEVSFCYTRVGEWEDDTIVESAPSPPTNNISTENDSTIKIDDFIDASEEGSFTTHYYIYRLNAGDSGAEFQYAGKLAKTDDPLEFYDNLGVTDLGEVLPTTGWTVPIDDLKGLITGSNGIAFGFNDNTLHPSELFIPYAFPDEYKLPVASEIVGLGFNGTAVVVLTKTVPFLVYGSDPASLSLEIRPVQLPCKSDRSIVSFPGGVIYSCPVGLALVNSDGVASVITQHLFTQEQWSALGPEKVFAFYYDDTYIAFFKGTSIGIEFKPGNNEIRRFDLGRPVYDGRYVSTVSTNVYSLLDSGGNTLLTSDGFEIHVIGDEYSLTFDTLYLIQANNDLDFSQRDLVAWQVGDLMDFEWATKVFTSIRQIVLTAGILIGDFTNGPVTIDLFIDGVLEESKVISDNEIFRFTNRKRGSRFQVILRGKGKVDRIVLGRSAFEIMKGF
ncbi:hypothetical protein [Desulfospira joergensenii]|uniref:hypothetical protein n=1 Tax=Desulfospira joergensenii TaxID=53329 RepID=UPI0003B334E9|nr:hypothetical protein [Desulfospira joergensenii]